MDKPFITGVTAGWKTVFEPLDYSLAKNTRDRKLTQIRRLWFAIGITGTSVAAMLLAINSEHVIVFLASCLLAAQENIDMFGSF